MTEALSVLADEETSGETINQFLTFYLGDEVFAMDIRSVREIIQFEAMTPVPLMPEFIRGIINLRGAVVPVVDMKSRFGWQRAAIGKKSCIIIFDASSQSERGEVGVLVDAVSEVLDLSDRQIEPAPQFGGRIQREFIHGVGKVDGRFILLLESSRLLDLDEMASLVERFGKSTAVTGG